MKRNDIKFETLRKSYVKPIFIGLVVFVVVMSVLVLRGTMAKYQYKKSVKLAEGIINYEMSDYNLIALNIQNDNGEYESASTVPSEGYTINSEKSYCEKLETDGTKTTFSDITIEYIDGELYFGEITQRGTKCYVYLDIATTKTITVGNLTLEVNLDTPNFANTSCASGCGEATVGIYEAEDDDGTTYYFRGDVENNYVKFAGYYWRIIRVNGDGSIRLIYDGTSAIANGANNSSSQIGKSAFNSSYSNNMYVGFMYTSGSVHGLGTSSTIKGVLDTWYTSNLADYASYIDTDAGFCGDRYPSTNMWTSNGSGGTSTTTTYYAAYIRLYTNKVPSYKCQTSTDLYTAKSSSKGNRALTNPIGLITADEVAYAGGVFGTTNKNYYLRTGNSYLILSPYSYNSDSNEAHVFNVDDDGAFSWEYVRASSGVRPVINLKASTIFSGSGTMEYPYQVI